MKIIGCPHNCCGAGDSGYRTGWASAEFLRNGCHQQFFWKDLSNQFLLKKKIIFEDIFYRSQCVSLMSRLHWLDKKQFCKFMKSLVENRSVHFLLSFFHSYLGFCSDLGNPFSPNPTNIPLSRKKSPSRPGPDSSPLGYSNNLSLIHISEPTRPY